MRLHLLGSNSDAHGAAPRDVHRPVDGRLHTRHVRSKQHRPLPLGAWFGEADVVLAERGVRSLPRRDEARHEHKGTLSNGFGIADGDRDGRSVLHTGLFPAGEAVHSTPGVHVECGDEQGDAHADGDDRDAWSAGAGGESARVAWP